MSEARYERRRARRTSGVSSIAEHYSRRGNASHAEGRLEEALSWFRKAASASPSFFGFYSWQGAILFELGALDEALESLDRAIALNPTDASSFNYRGAVLARQRQFVQAIESYDRAVVLEPGNPVFRINRGRARVTMGDFGGFEDFKLIDKLQRMSPDREWTGQESLLGKTILLHDGGAGIGDTFQFCKYAQLLADRGAEVILKVRPAIADLVRSLPAEVITSNGPPPPFDYQIALKNVACVLERSFDTLYTPKAYLRASAPLKALWRSRLGESGKPRIGLAWWTGTAWQVTGAVQSRATGPERSIPLGDLLLHLPPQFEYVSLQHEVRDADEGALRSSTIVHFGDEMTFDAAAAVIECCDLVIAIDSSLAHLAGALGRPVWIALRFDADWRWFVDRDDSPWYPTARLYRQRSEGEWRSVLERIGADLRSWVACELLGFEPSSAQESETDCGHGQVIQTGCPVCERRLGRVGVEIGESA